MDLKLMKPKTKISSNKKKQAQPPVVKQTRTSSLRMLKVANPLEFAQKSAPSRNGSKETALQGKETRPIKNFDNPPKQESSAASKRTLENRPLATMPKPNQLTKHKQKLEPEIVKRPINNRKLRKSLSADVIQIRNKKIKINVESQCGKNLYASVPEELNELSPIAKEKKALLVDRQVFKTPAAHRLKSINSNNGKLNNFLIASTPASSLLSLPGIMAKK